MPFVCAQLLSGTTANLSSHEHRVAIGTAADSLRHLRVRTLYPILDRASSKFKFLPELRILWACSLELTGATALTTASPFSENCSTGCRLSRR
jgi:hypothetical protein